MPKTIGKKEQQNREMRERRLSSAKSKKNGHKVVLGLREAVKTAKARKPNDHKAWEPKGRRRVARKGQGKGRTRVPRADQPRRVLPAKAASAATNHRPGTISAAMPWLAEGVSRRSWYRRKTGR